MTEPPPSAAALRPDVSPDLDAFVRRMMSRNPAERPQTPAEVVDSLTVLTYAAALTSTIRLGVSVLVLPTYNPIHVAHQWATLDYLSERCGG